MVIRQDIDLDHMLVSLIDLEVVMRQIWPENLLLRYCLDRVRGKWDIQGGRVRIGMSVKDVLQVVDIHNNSRIIDLRIRRIRHYLLLLLLRHLPHLHNPKTHQGITLINNKVGVDIPKYLPINSHLIVSKISLLFLHLEMIPLGTIHINSNNHPHTLKLALNSNNIWVNVNRTTQLQPGNGQEGTINPHLV
jgi:hypothetical protein